MIESGQKGNVLLSQMIMMSIPAMLGIYWPLFALNADFAAVILRPVILGSALMLALLWCGKPLTEAEIQLAGILTLLVVTLLVPSILATDPARALKEWAKLLLIAIVCFALARALRDRSTARIYAIGLVLSASVMGLFLLANYVTSIGLTVPTYEALRVYKGQAAKAGVEINAIAFSSLFSFFSAICILGATRILWAVGSALLLICTFLTGSRTPPVITVGAAVLLIMIAALRSRSVTRRLVAWICTACAGVALIAVLWITVSSVAGFRTMSKLSEGRWDVWSVALTKFTERPIFGYGYVSWRDDLASRLPGEYKLSNAMAEHIVGGYHNEVMTALAEQGLVGTAAVAGLFWFMLRCGWLLAYRRWLTWRHGRWALFVGIFALLHSNFEVSGLFGYAQDPADYLSYGFLAILVASISTEDDYLRSAGSAVTIQSGNIHARLPHFAGSDTQTKPAVAFTD